MKVENWKRDSGKKVRVETDLRGGEEVSGRIRSWRLRRTLVQCTPLVALCVHLHCAGSTLCTLCQLAKKEKHTMCSAVESGHNVFVFNK